MTVETFRNRSPYRGRAMDRSGFSWTPVSLAPYAWGDVHAGGTSTTITDRSGNGRADATYGATTAAPLYLPYTGTPYVHLEAAGAGTNSISCTAPANTASYSALPLGGGAATTGAAAEGAFAFTTAGDWTQIDLLDGSAVVLASFRASECTQTGVTDSFAVAWTLNYGTGGRKTVPLSPAANATRSLALFGTNDRIDVPAAWVPTLSTNQPGMVLAVMRKRATLGTNDRIYDSKPTTVATTAGIAARSGSATASDYVASTGDGTNQANGSITTGITAGQRLLIGHSFSATQVFGVINNTLSTGVTRTVGAPDGGPLVIGMNTTGGEPSDMEFEAVITFNYQLSVGQLALLNTYYKTGV